MSGGSGSQNEKHKASPAKVFAVVSFYMVAALIMVFVNKWVLLSSPLPLTFLFAQLVIAVVLIQATCLAGFLKLPPYDKKLIKDIFWVVVVNVSGLVFNTLCLQKVEASYFQVARGLVLPLTVLLTGLMDGRMPPMSTVACCAIVTCGFVYGVTPSAASATTSNPHSTQLGIFYGVLSAVMIAVHAVLVKWSMRSVDVRTMDVTFVTNLAYLTNLGSAILLFPVLVLTGEVMRWPGIFTGEEGSVSTFIIGSAVTGFFGFLICMAGLLSITVTSPVSHMFTAAVRSVLQTILGVIIFHDVLTVPRAGSIGLIILGSASYAYIKAMGGRRPPQQQQPVLPTTSETSSTVEEKEKLMKDEEVKADSKIDDRKGSVIFSGGSKSPVLEKEDLKSPV